jgi:non-homologous end joining protein Ku
MKNQDRVALARIVLANREHIIAIEPLVHSNWIMI